MSSQSEKGELFYSLHHRDQAFVIPNPWDVGTAKILAHFGFEALATTSAGFAFSIGRPDGKISREESLAHAAAIVGATNLPVSADLENGFGDDAKSAAETIRLAAQAGLAGGSIEDLPKGDDPVPYEIGHAAERIRAAAEVVRGLPFRFTLTARTENYLVGRPDLRDTIARLQAFQEAGADVLFAPGLTRKEDIVEVVRSVNRPVNVIMGLQGARFSVTDLSAMGVKRISVGSALARAAFGALLRGAKEICESGTFEFANEAATYRELTELFKNSNRS